MPVETIEQTTQEVKPEIKPEESGFFKPLENLFNAFTGESKKEAVQAQEPVKVQTVAEKVLEKTEKLQAREAMNNAEVKDIESRKKAKLAKKRARVKSASEWMLEIRLMISERLEHFGFLLIISWILLATSLMLHSWTFHEILVTFMFKGQDGGAIANFGIWILAGGIATALDITAIAMFEKCADEAAYFLDGMVLVAIVGMGYYEYAVKGTGGTLSIIRAGLGSVLFAAMLALNHYMRKRELMQFRRPLELSPRATRKSVYAHCKKVYDQVQKDKKDKGNFKDVCKVYKITSTSFFNHLVKINMASSYYFKQTPSRRTTKKNKVVTNTK